MTTQTIPFTLAPTTRIDETPANLKRASQIDAIQNTFNMSLNHSGNRADLLPLSDKLFDLFCAYEMGAEEADEMLIDVIHALKASPCHYDGCVLDAINALSDLDETTLTFDPAADLLNH